jgi:hypothetical protein
MSNGELLRAANGAQYDVFVTIDQGVPHQQNLVEQSVAVIVLRAPTNQLEDLLPLVNQIEKALRTIRAGQVVSVPE